MKSMREQLQPGEEVLYVAHPTRMALHGALIGILLVLLTAAGVWDRIREFYVWVIALLALVPLVLTILRQWLYIISNQFVLTNRRVVKQTGLVSKESVTSYLDKINNVEHRQTVWGRMLGYGDVEIDTASETGTTTFRSIVDPIRFQRAILQASEGYRTRPASAAASQPAVPTGAERLRELKQLLDDGLITEDEYEEKRREMLRAL
jgi:uncharacterized membrane protein YdbT with pleckstrin-like domain